MLSRYDSCTSAALNRTAASRLRHPPYMYSPLLSPLFRLLSSLLLLFPSPAPSDSGEFSLDVHWPKSFLSVVLSFDLPVPLSFNLPSVSLVLPTRAPEIMFIPRPLPHVVVDPTCISPPFASCAHCRATTLPENHTPCTLSSVQNIRIRVTQSWFPRSRLIRPLFVSLGFAVIQIPQHPPRSPARPRSRPPTIPSLAFCRPCMSRSFASRPPQALSPTPPTLS